MVLTVKNQGIKVDDELRSYGRGECTRQQTEQLNGLLVNSQEPFQWIHGIDVDK